MTAREIQKLAEVEAIRASVRLIEPARAGQTDTIFSERNFLSERDSMSIQASDLREMVRTAIAPHAQRLAHENAIMRHLLGECNPATCPGCLANAKRFDEAMTDLADIFVGPKIAKGGVEESARQQRKRARKAFIEGRAA